MKSSSGPEPLGDNSTFISPLSQGIIIVFGCGLFLISANFLLSSNKMMSANKPFCSGEDISGDTKAMTQIITVKNALYVNVKQNAKKVPNLPLLSTFSWILLYSIRSAQANIIPDAPPIIMYNNDSIVSLLRVEKKNVYAINEININIIS